MKKPVFYVFLILILLAACSSDSDEANDKQSGHLPAPAAQSLTSVTVYLDGSGHSESRAMNKDFAMMSCDYFEVVFLGNNNGVLVPARGQWRIGDKAGVNGVYRTPAGVNYGGVSPAPTPGTGSALLLAGKSDKTLMAIGKLSAAIYSNISYYNFRKKLLRLQENIDFFLNKKAPKRGSKIKEKSPAMG